VRPGELEPRFQARLNGREPTPVSLAPGVRSDGQVLGRSPAFRDYEESIALEHYILDLRDEMRRQDDELARIVSNALVHRPGNGQDAHAVLHAAFAQHVDEGAGGAGVALLNGLVDLPRSHVVRTTRSSRKSTQEAHQIAEEMCFPAPLAEDARGRVWSRYEVQAWANRWRGEKPWR
jgi:hypothetical protein